jgi:hypothetical protein
MLLFILSEVGIGLDGRTLFDGTRVLPQANSWSPGWHVLPGDAKWNTWRLNAMVAWTILGIFIGTAVLVGSAGPTTFTPSIHFPTCNYSAWEVCQGEVQQYLMVWPYHETFITKPMNFTLLASKDFIYIFPFYLKDRNWNKGKEKQLLRWNITKTKGNKTGWDLLGRGSLSPKLIPRTGLIAWWLLIRVPWPEETVYCLKAFLCGGGKGV